jgi:hypothetical protein
MEHNSLKDFSPDNFVDSSEILTLNRYGKSKNTAGTANYGVTITPGLVINGKVFSLGKIPVK